MLAIESEVGSSLLLVITFRTQNVQKSDTESPLRALTATKIRTKELERGQELL